MKRRSPIPSIAPSLLVYTSASQTGWRMHPQDLTAAGTFFQKYFIIMYNILFSYQNGKNKMKIIKSIENIFIKMEDLGENIFVTRM